MSEDVEPTEEELRLIGQQLQKECDRDQLKGLAFAFLLTLFLIGVFLATQSLTTWLLRR